MPVTAYSPLGGDHNLLAGDRALTLTAQDIQTLAEAYPARGRGPFGFLRGLVN
jgi:hypothetical protein